MKAAKFKKLTLIFLCIALCITMAIPGMAAGINMSVFEGVSGINVVSDPMEGMTFVDVKDKTSLTQIIDYDDIEFVNLYPSILLTSEGKLVFRIFGDYVAESWAFVDTIIIKVNNTTYTYNDVELDTTILDTSRVSILEETCIIVNWESRELLEAIKQHRYEPIMVRFSGSKKDIDFTLSDEVKDKIVLFYDLFTAAGGVTQSNMSNSGETATIRHFAQTIEDKENIYISVYDYDYYKANNPDLVALYGNNREEYLNHFISAGMKEGRQGNQLFKLDVYKANNPDLVAAFGEDNVKYYEHFMKEGRAEGRVAA